MNNKTLAILLSVMIIVFVLTKVFRASSRNTNMHTDIFTLDKTQITKIEIHPHRTPGETVSLEKSSTGWEVVERASRDRTESGSVQQLLPMLTRVQAARLISRKKSDWNAYGVGDTTGTHVIVYHQSKPLADFWVGDGSSASQTSTTYLRMQGQNTIYQAAAGYLASSLDKSYDAWRDPSLVRITGSQISKVTFLYPRDTGFTLEKNGDNWSIGGLPTDSERVAAYLDKFAYQGLHHFVPHFTPPANPTMEISIGSDSAQLAVVDAWRADSLWVLSSSERPNVYFSSQGSDIMTSLFIGKASLLRH